jgi:radical SAM protein (TIGR01212 family)
MTDKRPYYRTFSSYLKEQFGQRVHRISIDAGFTCPNRDGTIGYGGCGYCSPHGSWNNELSRLTINEQVKQQKERIKKRYRAHKFLAYFQAYTNTYAPASRLKAIYDSVLLGDEDFVGVIIGTRPDCIDRDKLDLISSYSKLNLKVWIEYGLQSARERTLKLIGRGHGLKAFQDAVRLTREYGIGVGTHVIIGLPGESRIDIRHTADFLSEFKTDIIKLHNLNIIEGTKMAEWHRDGKLKPLGLGEYADYVVEFLERISPEVAVARLVAESNQASLIGPKWSLDKGQAIQEINHCFEDRKSYQGRLYKGGSF